MATESDDDDILKYVGLTLDFRGMAKQSDDDGIRKRSVCGAANQNIRACLVVAFAGLLRSCEVCLQDGKAADWQKSKHFWNASLRLRMRPFFGTL